MAEQQEQNRSEAPTPFKLKRAREKGMIARSTELGFLGGLVALAAFATIAGPGLIQLLAQIMRRALSAGIERAPDTDQAGAMLGEIAWSVLKPLMLLGGTVVAIVILLEMIQLRGLIFTAHPLKPDFTRLNPATGIKRLLSMRLLKETLKTIIKSAAYGIACWLILQDAIQRYATAASDGSQLAQAIASASVRLVFMFMAIAIGFVILDQLLVRGEFLKQMRMSRREVTREAKDREGDPRIKAKRKQLHVEFAKQSKGVDNLRGSDLLVVNPEHFAVALRYDPERMGAPAISAKGRNRFALALRDEAQRLGIPVLRRPALARALYRAAQTGQEIPFDHFEAVAELYIELRRAAASRDA